MRQKISRITRAQAGLLVIDIQEKLLPQIHEREHLIQNSVRLIKGAEILSLPIFATEQYRKGLGLTDKQVASAIPGFAPIEKVSFSSCGAEGLIPMIEAKRLTDLLLCGIEAHICVLQTCLDLLDRGFNVFPVADAISAREPQNIRIALERMSAAGAVAVTTEMAFFEMIERAATEEFKKILALVR